MTTIAYILAVFFLSQICLAQSNTTSGILKSIGNEWKLDSNSCKGYRISKADLILKSKIDSITSQYLFSHLGKPNKVQKFYSGITNKNYIGYIYYIYKDACPKINFEGEAIQFVFEIDDIYLSEVTTNSASYLKSHISYLKSQISYPSSQYFLKISNSLPQQN